MKLFLNTTLKGLLVALLTITLGGFLYINLSAKEKINLQLISTSLANQIETSSEAKDTTVLSVVASDEENNLVEEDKDNKEIDNNLEVEEDIKEQVPTALNPEVSDNSDNSDNVAPSSEETSVNSEASTPSQNSSVELPQGAGYAPNLEVANTYSALETYYGKMTAYGPDCVGCRGYVAHGEYVGEGNIYYNDKTFGRIRIVAGDTSLPFGTIVRIKGLSISSDPLIAIVLDTGGDIGFNKTKQIYFDLLYETEAAASSFGMPYATFEILRKGY